MTKRILYFDNTCMIYKGMSLVLCDKLVENSYGSTESCLLENRCWVKDEEVGMRLNEKYCRMCSPEAFWGKH